MKQTLIKFRKSILTFAKIFMLAVLTVMLGITYYSEYQAAWFFLKGNILAIAMYVILLFFFVRMYGGFDIGFLRKNEITYSMSVSVIFANVIFYIMLCLIAKKPLDVRPMLILTVFQIVLGTILSFLFTKLYFSLYPARNVVLICHDRDAAQSIINKVKMIKERYVLRCVLPDTLDFEKMVKVIKNFESVLIYELDSELKEKLLDYCYSEGKRVYIVPTVQDLIIANCNFSQIFDTTAVLCKNRGPSTEEKILKRTADIIVSFIGLIVSSPLILLTALLVKFSDKGPVLYKQERLTENGRVFTLYKFRSMRVDAEADGKARLASANDDRVTSVGKFIRATRLDELPQLYNILKGDMSLVGPRPERPEISEEYEKKYPEFKYRLKMKAGLTGYAQVNGKYNSSPRDKLLMDLIYIQQFSLLLDIKLVFQTFKIVFMPDSAEGFNKEKTDISQIEFINEENE